MVDRPTEKIIERTLDKETDDLPTAIVSEIADIEGKDPMDLPPIWRTTNDVLEDLYSDPPSSHAQMKVEFSYQNYRVTADQDGTVEFIKTE